MTDKNRVPHGPVMLQSLYRFPLPTPAVFTRCLSLSCDQLIYTPGIRSPTLGAWHIQTLAQRVKSTG